MVPFGNALKAFLLLGALATAASGASFKKVTFRDQGSDLEMHIYFDSLKPGSRTLEYSGDYRAKKKAFRIFAQEDFWVEAGDFKGWAEDHWLEKRSSDDEPPEAVIAEYEFHATLLNPKGDTLHLEGGSPTSQWKVGLELQRAYRRVDGTHVEGAIPIIAMDDLERDFPDIPSAQTGIARPFAMRWDPLLGPPRPPPGATRLEAFDIAGRTIYSGSLKEGAIVQLPASVRVIRFF